MTTSNRPPRNNSTMNNKTKILFAVNLTGALCLLIALSVPVRIIVFGAVTTPGQDCAALAMGLVSFLFFGPGNLAADGIRD